MEPTSGHETPRLLVWLHAARPKTLPAALVPVLVGSAYAHAAGSFRLLPALAALWGALWIQVGTNFANDYYDAKKGADTPDRLGPPRATAQGWLTPPSVLTAAFVAFFLAAAAGAYLIAIAGWPILVIGVASLLSGYAYTGGPYPLGYHGWGEAFVLLFFGPVAVGGTYWVQAGLPPTQVLLAGLAIGSIASAILVVNNLRDIPTDLRAGKKTLAVRFGAPFARAEYVFLVVAPFLIVLQERTPWTLFALPLALILSLRIARETDPRRLNARLGQTATLLLFFGLLLAAQVAFP